MPALLADAAAPFLVLSVVDLKSFRFAMKGCHGGTQLDACSMAVCPHRPVAVQTDRSILVEVEGARAPGGEASLQCLCLVVRWAGLGILSVKSVLFCGDAGS